MHSNIIQLAKNPIDRENWVKPYELEDNSSDFSDYIGDEKTEEERQEIIKWLASTFDGILELDGETLIYKGMGSFLKDWSNHIKHLAEELEEDNPFYDMGLYLIRSATEQTHLNIWSRFYVEDWNDWPGSAADFVNWMYNQLTEGDRIYVGAIIDYHF